MSTTRDPERIDSVLDALRTYWKAHPDHRLGQIVFNAARTGPTPLDVFNMEEEQLLSRLARMQLRDDQSL